MTSPKNRYATVLQLRRDYPDASIDDIAAKLSEITRTNVRPEAFRKNLQRARAKFIELLDQELRKGRFERIELLVQELKKGIQPSDDKDIEAEIFDFMDRFQSRRLHHLQSGEVLDSSSLDEVDEDFDRVWREALINRVWSRLETYQAKTQNNRYASVLQLRRDFPKISIEKLADKLGEITRTPIRPEAFRKQLEDARAKFIELLVQEVRETIHSPSTEDVEAEIFDLGLGHLYRRYSAATEE